MWDQSGDSAIPLGYSVMPRRRRRWPFFVAVSAGVLLIAGGGYAALAWYRMPKPRTDCISNLSVIGGLMEMYADDHGVYPPDFQALIDGRYTVEKVFCCPRCKPVPGSLYGCYVYLPDQPVRGHPFNVLVYEREGHHADGDYSVAVAGAVYSNLRYKQMMKMVEETKARLKAGAATQPGADTTSAAGSSTQGVH